MLKSWCDTCKAYSDGCEHVNPHLIIAIMQDEYTEPEHVTLDQLRNLEYELLLLRRDIEHNHNRGLIRQRIYDAILDLNTRSLQRVYILKEYLEQASDRPGL